MAQDNLFSKKNVLIGGGVALCIIGVGFLVYSNRQKALYQAIWDKADNPDVSSGQYGDWRDVYDSPAWNPVYMNQAGVSPTTLDYGTAKDYAQKIHDAKGTVSSKQDDVVAIFNKLNNKTDVAKLSSMFASMKFGNLKDYMKSFMEGNITRKNYMEDIYTVLLKLPK